MEDIINNFSVVSSARVNWAKSEALAVGEGVATGVKLPGGLVWKRGGIKYLGVFVGSKDYMKKNWENTLEIVEGRVRKWRWIFPKLSYKGRVLVLNNLVSSMLWHRLTCVDPPPDLLPKVQAILVNAFWDKLHWLPQSILYLQKEDGGHGLMHLASRRATFRLEFIKRFLTGPKDLVWKPLACSISRRVGEYGLDATLFLLDLSPCVFNNIPDFYRSVFNVWTLFKKERIVCPALLYWLLNEPVLSGGRFSRHATFGPTFQRMFIKSKVTTLGQVVELAGPDLEDAAALAEQIGMRSLRLVQQALDHWRQQLTGNECVF